MVIFRIIVNLGLIFWGQIWYPLTILRSNGLAVIITLIAGYFMYSVFFVEDDRNLMTPPSSSTSANTPIFQKPKRIILQDGNSNFSNNLLKSMKKEDLLKYTGIFYHAMSYTKNGESYPWQWGNMEGKITPTKSFKNKNGDICRYFNEILRVGEIKQTLSGTSCKKYDGSWCKLRSKVTSTPMCGIHKKGVFGNILNSIGGLF